MRMNLHFSWKYMDMKCFIHLKIHLRIFLFTNNEKPK